MFVCKPISWPVGKLLDCMLGHHSGTVYKRGEIKAIVDIHREKGEITCEEEAVIDGAIDFTSKQAGQCMTALAHVKTLGKSQILNADVVNQILSWGHSRIPVVDDDGESFIGVLLVKELIKPGAIPDSGGMVCGMNLRPLVHITESMHLYSLLSIFKMGRSHMALVYTGTPPGRAPAARGTLTPPAKASATPIGIVTLEDLVEELIQGEIVDETDLEGQTAAQARASRRGPDFVRVTHSHARRAPRGRTDAATVEASPQEKPSTEGPTRRPQGVRGLSVWGRRALRRKAAEHQETQGTLP
ncbi:unnamed protein product [Prorocentrum cordatum]|nr:unnamed protein product [Polarella glacialis]